MGAIFLNGNKYPGPNSNNSNAYYDYYFENIPCLETSPSRTTLNLHNTYSILRSSENRDWEAIINFENHQTDTDERSPFGIRESTGSGPYVIELFVTGQNSDTRVCYKYIDGTSEKHIDIIGTGNLNNTDIIFRKTGSNLDIIVNNSVVTTIPFNIRRDSNTQNITLGCYYGTRNYYFIGIINKFGFRWLN